MISTGSRPTWAEINLDAVEHNVKCFLNLLPSSTQLMAVVKANGYGHGADWVAKAALKAGASCLGVAFIDEAIMLRQSSIDASILILGYSTEEAMIKALEYDVQITVTDDHSFHNALRVAEMKSQQMNIHIKVDTGMGRLGFTDYERVISLVEHYSDHPFLKVKGLFTHLACADEEDPSHTRKQLALFQALQQRLPKNIVFHALNSAGALQHTNMSLDLVRVGIGLYGLAPSSFLKNNVVLQAVLSFKTKIAQVKEVSAGTTVSYGATFTAPKAMTIATLPVGYADGYNRMLSSKGEVLIHGKRVPIIGRICMDQMMVDVSKLTDVKTGDEVVLYGKQQENEITVDEIATRLNTINYEICCNINHRVPRVYYTGQHEVGIANKLLDKKW